LGACSSLFFLFFSARSTRRSCHKNHVSTPLRPHIFLACTCYIFYSAVLHHTPCSCGQLPKHLLPDHFFFCDKLVALFFSIFITHRIDLPIMCTTDYPCPNSSGTITLFQRFAN
jgi:hypothetical protein